MIAVAMPGHVLQAALSESREGLPTDERRVGIDPIIGIHIHIHDDSSSRMNGSSSLVTTMCVVLCAWCYMVGARRSYLQLDEGVEVDEARPRDRRLIKPLSAIN